MFSCASEQLRGLLVGAPIALFSRQGDDHMQGEVIYFYAFDVANEIITDRIGKILGAAPEPFALRLGHGTPKDVAFHRPLSVEPHSAGAMLAGQPVQIQIHIFQVGVVSIVLRAAFEQSCLADLHPYHKPILADGRSLDDLAREYVTRVRDDLRDAMVRAAPRAEPEAYTVFCVSDVAGEDGLARWLADHRTGVAALLSDVAPERISDAQVNEVLRQTWSLEKDDITVIDWDAALVVNLAGPPNDVLYVLEVANLQLEEFRMMDLILDGALDRAYDDLERRTTRFWGTSTRVLSKLRWLRVDLTRLADEVTNITKFVGDWYLARVYLGARERF